MLNLEFAQEVGYGQYFYRTFLRQFHKRIIHQDNKIRLPNGNIMNLLRNSRSASEIFVSNCNVDWGSEQILIKNLEPDKAFLDVGANIGYYSLLAADRVNKVYAFEPDKRNLKLLNKNISNISNIEIITRPVYSQVQEIQFNMNNCSEVSHIVTDNSNHNHIQATKLITTTLNNFIEDNQKISITGIKIDVEGADFDVLLGENNLIKKDKLFEYINNFKYKNFAFVKPLLTSKNINNKFIFREIKRDIKDNFRYKMIFLFSLRLQNIFSGYIKIIKAYKV